MLDLKLQTVKSYACKTTWAKIKSWRLSLILKLVTFLGDCVVRIWSWMRHFSKNRLSGIVLSRQNLPRWRNLKLSQSYLWLDYFCNNKKNKSVKREFRIRALDINTLSYLLRLRESLLQHVLPHTQTITSMIIPRATSAAHPIPNNSNTVTNNLLIIMRW